MMLTNVIDLLTPRLTLTPFQPGDAASFHQINTHPYVRKYLWDDECISMNTAQEIMNGNAQHFRESQFGLWKIKVTASGEIIGYTGLWYFFEEVQPQLLYAILPEYNGQGYATEAAQKVMDYAFAKLGFNYLIAATDPPNLASQKVAERLGMQMEEKKVIEGKTTLFYKIVVKDFNASNE